MSSKQRNEQQRASTFSSIGGNEGEAAATTALVPFNNFLDFFNGAGFDDEGTLAKICDRDAVEKLPDPSTVKNYRTWRSGYDALKWSWTR